MDLTSPSWHETLVVLAVVLGTLGCLVSLGYVIRVDARDNWRRPMLVTAVLGAAAVLGAWYTGERLLEAQPELARFAQVEDHRAYARYLVVPTLGWLGAALVTGLVHPRTGVLKVVLPLLLTLTTLAVLVLVLLSGSEDVRSVWESILAEF